MPYCVVFIRYVDKLELCAVCGFLFSCFLIVKSSCEMSTFYYKWFTANEMDTSVWLICY